MALEVERKFLVRDDRWQQGATGAARLRQGYLARGDGCTVRIRLVQPLAGAGATGVLTIKGPTEQRSGSLVRQEFEYPVPMADAQALLALCGTAVVEKVRHRVPAAAGLTFEVDVFAGANAGLVLAELELPSADTPVPATPWLGRDVSADGRFANARLVSQPWPDFAVDYTG